MGGRASTTLRSTSGSTPPRPTSPTCGTGPRHHSEGIFACEEVFGSTLTNSAGRVVPVRQIGEQHVMEDLGRIPTAADWLRAIKVEPWMLRKAKALADVESD